MNTGCGVARGWVYLAIIASMANGTKWTLWQDTWPNAAVQYKCPHSAKSRDLHWDEYVAAVLLYC